MVRASRGLGSEQAAGAPEWVTRACRCVGSGPGLCRCAGSVAPGHASRRVWAGRRIVSVSRAQRRGRAGWGSCALAARGSCGLRLPALPSLPPTFISVFLLLFFFRTWSLPSTLSLLSCVLTRRPALLPADVHGWAPRLCSVRPRGRLLPGMGLAAGGSAVWACWGFHTTVL